MATKEDYAMLSAAAYNAHRGVFNKISLAPTGWSQISTSSNSITGFGAQAYQKGTGTSTEIVIAYEGTNAYSSYSDANGDWMWDRLWSTTSDWLFGDLPLMLGNVFGSRIEALTTLFGQQIFQAALFYAQVKVSRVRRAHAARNKSCARRTLLVSNEQITSKFATCNTSTRQLHD
ncbi:MAG: hypothetical protein WAO71_05365 [Gallionella sp.]